MTKPAVRLSNRLHSFLSIQPQLGGFYKLDKVLKRIVPTQDRVAGLVVKASAWRAEDPGFESRLRRVESYQ